MYLFFLFLLWGNTVFSVSFSEFAEMLRNLKQQDVNNVDYSVYAEEGVELITPIPAILSFHAQFINSNGLTKVLEIGPGEHPIVATHYLDNRMQRYNLLEGTIGWNLDIDFDRIPVDDNYFDFVYCRNLLQDLNNPVHAFNEMMRVSKNGYIETPSPAYSTIKFVVNQNMRFRGMYQHRFFVWTDKFTNQLFDTLVKLMD